MTIDLDLGVLLTSIIASCVTFLGVLLVKNTRAVDRLTHVIESTQPAGVLIRVDHLEQEYRELREWALAQGYDRRQDRRP